MQVITADMDSLNLDPENPRDHDRENIDAIRASLRAFGQVVPLVVHRASNTIIGGNGTYRALRDLGRSTCDIVFYNGSPDEARALSVALNRTAELAIWNEDNLAKALVAMEESGIDLASVGWSPEALEVMWPTPAVPAQWEPPRSDPELEPRTRERKPAEPKEYSYLQIFDSQEQIDTYLQFTAWLKEQYPSYETTGERLTALATRLMDAEG